MEAPVVTKDVLRKDAKSQRKTQRGSQTLLSGSFASFRLCVRSLFLLLGVLVFSSTALPQTNPNQAGSHTTRVRAPMPAETKALLEQAMVVVCTQAKLDPKSSVAIDEMQARPSLPLQSPEARAGAERAQRLLPVAKNLLITSLRQLSTEYGLEKSPKFNLRVQQAIARVNSVQRVKPDMESRDNASVYLSKPHVITFGTIFLAGLRSDEGMVSVLAHELMHIADGDNDSLRALVTAVGNKASDLTGLDIHGQRAEEVTCDLLGAMAVRAYIVSTPDYESIARRLARSLQHNCVDLDEGDEDHLSPRNTIRALLALNPDLVRELINDRF
jgi:Zn-dependent protease with chaperone function